MRVVGPEKTAKVGKIGRPIRRIAILAADSSVLKPVQRSLGIVSEQRSEGAFSTATYKGATVITGVTPAGLVSAQASAEAFFLRYGDSIDHLFIVAISSAFDLHLGIGEVVFPEAVVDCRDGIPRYPVTPGERDSSGVIYSSDHRQCDDDYVAALNHYNVSGVDSVTGAVAAVCDRHGCAFTVVSAVSEKMDLLAEPRDLFQLAGLPSYRSALRFALRRPQRIAYLIAMTLGIKKAIARAATEVLASVESLLQQPRQHQHTGNVSTASSVRPQSAVLVEASKG